MIWAGDNNGVPNNFDKNQINDLEEGLRLAYEVIDGLQNNLREANMIFIDFFNVFNDRMLQIPENLIGKINFLINIDKVLRDANHIVTARLNELSNENVSLKNQVNDLKSQTKSQQEASKKF